MAEMEPELKTREEQIAHAKELYARGYRNYVVGDFNEAAEDLSRSCELYATLYGDESEEVAIPNLFYGKTLIELAQMGENKVLALPDQEEEEGDEDDEEGGEEEEEAEVEGEDGASTSAASAAPKPTENDVEMEKPSSNGAGPSNGGASSSASSSEPQPGTSSGIQSNGSNGNADNGAEEANENLQFAWEALEMAAKIFRRLGVGYEEYLAESHYGLGEISMENQNCPEAIRDYNIAFELFSKVEPVKERHLAEIKYKTGLCHYTAGNYDQSIADLEKSAEYMQQSIAAQKKLEQTPAVEQLIDDLTKTREDIIIKIADVQETKQLLRSNLITKGGYGALLAEDAKAAKAGESSSSSQQPDKPKANDISHLIKRKKPEASAEGASASEGASPAKKPAP